jgi:hypothetical protein
LARPPDCQIFPPAASPGASDADAVANEVQTMPIGLRRRIGATMSKQAVTTPAAAGASPLFKNDVLHLAFCVVGVVGSLLLYGGLQVCRCHAAPWIARLHTPETAAQSLVPLSFHHRLAARCNSHMQERIMTIPYGVGDQAEVFKYSLFLVFCNRSVAATIAALTLLVSGGREARSLVSCVSRISMQ